MSRILTIRRVLLMGFLVAGIVSAWLVHFALQTSAATASVPPGWPTIVLTPITLSVTNPVYVTHAGDGSGRIFIVERQGSVRIYKNGAVLPTPFLNINSRVQSGYEEQGLLSIAFPPDYALKQAFLCVL